MDSVCPSFYYYDCIIDHELCRVSSIHDDPFRVLNGWMDGGEEDKESREKVRYGLRSGSQDHREQINSAKRDIWMLRID